MLTSFTGEIASLEFLLLTDGEIALTHEEDENTEYPRTWPLPYNAYNEDLSLGFVFSGKQYTAYISSEEQIESYARALAQYLATALLSGNFTYEVSGQVQSSPYAVFEIALAPSASADIKSTLNNALTGNAFYRELQKQNLYSTIFISGYDMKIIVSKTIEID